MAPQNTRTASLGTYVSCYVAIAISAVFMLFPAVRTLPFAKVVISVVILALLTLSIRRGRKNGNLQLSVSQIHEQAKGGRKFAPVALEVAATVVAMIAFWMTI